LTCYKGYDLKNSQCVISNTNSNKPTDLGCGIWDWDNQKCLQCSVRWIFNANGKCVPVSDFCSLFDAKGVCTACFKGYDLKNGQCILSDSNYNKPSDLGCSIWDWDNQRCLQCSVHWIFNTNGKCVPVSDYCSSFDSKGVCTACFKGYDLKNGQCILSDSNNNKPLD
jgi:hypothetical protein